MYKINEKKKKIQTMKTKIIFLLFAAASAWGDPFFFPEDQDNEITSNTNWRMKRNAFLHRIGKRNFHLPPLFQLKKRMAHPFYEQAKVLKKIKKYQ